MKEEILDEGRQQVDEEYERVVGRARTRIQEKIDSQHRKAEELSMKKKFDKEQQKLAQEFEKSLYITEAEL